MWQNKEKKKQIKLNKSKTAATDAKSYRTITLSSFILKLLERLVLYRLEETAFTWAPLHPSQHGFVRSKNMETARSTLVDNIEMLRSLNTSGLIIFLDIKGASIMFLMLPLRKLSKILPGM